MYDPKYDLVTDEKRHMRKGGLKSKIVLAGSAAALLVLGALYAPLLSQNTGIAAEPATVAQATTPVALVDSSLTQDQAAFAALYELIAPSVVNIQVESMSQSAQLPDIPGFQLPPGLPQDQQPVQGEGSGFIYDNDGHVVTNNHVVESATSVVVNFSNGMWAKAEVVATDPQADLAVLKVTPPAGMEWRALPLADDGSVKVGYTVIAFGNPFGLENTMTTGIVSALGRSFPVGSFGSNRYSLPDVIQTDAAINPGNSGGPLLDLNGKVVGVNFAIESTVRSNSGVGFSIPVSIVKRVVPELIKDGKFEYAYLGLQGSTITAQLAEAVGLPDNQLGVYVSSVVPGGPAAKAGVKGGSQTVSITSGVEFQKGGDIVTAIGDQPVRRFEDVVSYLIEKAAPGQKVTLTVMRDGQENKIEVQLAERPAQTTASAQQGNPDQINARAAIALAEDAVTQQGGLTGEILEKTATPGEQDGKATWVVELATANQKATVIVDAESGEVLDVTIQ